jgi:hypothetical protein
MTYVGKKPASIIATAVDTTTGTFSGDLTVDTNTLYVDSANNRVGVGTVSPANTLSVEGSGTGLNINSTNDEVKKIVFENSGTTTGYIGSSSSSPIRLLDGSANERMRIDSSGNVGIGVVPETWTTSLSTRALQVGDVTSIHEVASEYSRFASNMYYDGTFKYITSNPATRYTQQGGTHVWDYASSGSADGAITFNEAMRIDSSGNLLVGKTSSGIATAGIELRSNDDVLITSNGSQALYLNRLSSDGSIVEFRQAGTTKGSIGVNTKLYIGGSGETHTTGVSFQGSGTSTNRNISPSDGSGSLVDGAINLGSSSSRWNSLWLSGGAYIGGTGSANYLDDYEEGTFTPTWNGYTTLASTSGKYVKVGNQVTVYAKLVTGTDTDSSAVGINNLPFTITGDLGGGSVFHNNVNFRDQHWVTAFNSNSTSCYLYGENGGADSTVRYNGTNPQLGGSATLIWVLHYQTF